MARGIVLPFTLNPKEFLRGLKRVEVGLDDVKDTLGDVEDAGDDALDGLDTDKAERGLEDISDAAEDAEDSLTNLGSEAKSEMGKVETAAQKAGAEVESELKDGAKDAEKAFSGLGSKAKAEMRTVGDAADRAGAEVGEIEDEAAQSAKEFGASFRGDPAEALEEVQALTSELANKLIPGVGGAVLSIAGGVAFGALLNFYEKWREEQERRTEEIREWRDATLDAFEDAADGLAREDVLGGFKDQLDEAGVSVTDFLGAAEEAGPEIEQAFARAFRTGAPEDFAAAQDLVNRSYSNLAGLVSAGNSQFDRQYQALGTVTKALGTYGTELTDGIGQAEAWADEVLGLEDAAAAPIPTITSLAEEVEILADATSDAASEVAGLGDEFADADEAADNYQASLEDTSEAVKELTEGGVKPLTDGLAGETEEAREAKDTLRDLAADTLSAAGAQVQLDGDTAGAIQTTKDGRRAFIDAATQLGLSEQAANDYADELGLIPDDVDTTVRVNNTEALEQIARTRAALLDIDDRYVSVFVTEVKRDEAWASRAPDELDG